MLRSKGSVLVPVMFFVLVGTILAVIFIKEMGGTEVGMVGADRNRRLAFCAAEAGINRAIWKIAESRRWTLISLDSGGGFDVAGATFSVKTAYLRDDETPAAPGEVTSWILIESMGRCESEEVKIRTILHGVFADLSHVAIYTGSADFDLVRVTPPLPPEGGPIQVPELPTFDFDFYRKLAQDQGTYHPGPFTFRSPITYYGIHFVEGDARIEGATIYGTVVATGNITIDTRGADYSVEVYAQHVDPDDPNSPYYPALVAGGSIVKIRRVSELIVKGLMYSANDMIFYVNPGGPINILGAIMAPNIIVDGRGTTSTLTLDTSYLKEPIPGYTPPSQRVVEAAELKPGSWAEE